MTDAQIKTLRQICDRRGVPREAAHGLRLDRNGTLNCWVGQVAFSIKRNGEEERE